jgi:hypothetical protein
VYVCTHGALALAWLVCPTKAGSVLPLHVLAACVYAHVRQLNVCAADGHLRYQLCSSAIWALDGARVLC